MRLRNIPRADEIIETHPRVLRQGEKWKGKWKEIFDNTNPIHIEIGMGKGQFLRRLAKQNKGINYVGIEKYSSVLLRAVEGLEQEEREAEACENIYFLHMNADRLTEVFGQGEVSGIYLNFSDPWPKARHSRRRLTSKEFLQRYEKLLPKGAFLEFKTDHQDLFDFSLAQLEERKGFSLVWQTKDLYSEDRYLAGNVPTEYEEKFRAKANPICKLVATRI